MTAREAIRAASEHVDAHPADTTPEQERTACDAFAGRSLCKNCGATAIDNGADQAYYCRPCALGALKPGQLPNVTGVNISVSCSRGPAVLPGHAMWTIRKTAQLHSSSCQGARFFPCDILEAYMRRPPSGD